jgi:hypothetical protein
LLPLNPATAHAGLTSSALSGDRELLRALGGCIFDGAMTASPRPWLARLVKGRGLMERIGEGIYRCTVCGGEVQVDADETPVAVLVGQSGKPNERVVTVGNVEVHRCSFPADRGRVFEAAVSAQVATNGSPRPSARVAQAVGMISVQADCLIEDAFALLSECAFETNRTLDEVAVAVIERRIRFDEMDEQQAESN